MLLNVYLQGNSLSGKTDWWAEQSFGKAHWQLGILHTRRGHCKPLFRASEDSRHTDSEGAGSKGSPSKDGRDAHGQSSAIRPTSSTCRHHTPTEVVAEQPHPAAKAGHSSTALFRLTVLVT